MDHMTHFGSSERESMRGPLKANIRRRGDQVEINASDGLTARREAARAKTEGLHQLTWSQSELPHNEKHNRGSIVRGLPCINSVLPRQLYGPIVSFLPLLRLSLLKLYSCE